MDTRNETTRFLLNAEEAICETWSASPLLDWLRDERWLRGTKEGCREGDCGACAVLVGEYTHGGEYADSAASQPRYRAHPSCLMSIGELEGRHLVTIEGLAAGADALGLEGGLTPVMRALLEENGSQCGFCSPGFVVSLTAWLLEGEEGGVLTEEGALRAIEGNLCRCTGYASLRRAASLLLSRFSDLPQNPVERIALLVERGVVPSSLLAFARRGPLPRAASAASKPARIVGGGSDLSVREPRPKPAGRPFFTRMAAGLDRIRRDGDLLNLGAAVTVRDFFASPLVREAVPGIEAFESDFASILVRNRATLGGNIANASPVADMTAIFLALGTELRLAFPDTTGVSEGRRVALEDFFLGYKKTSLVEGEIIAGLSFPALAPSGRFSFGKLAKRERLDIAAVNSALRLRLSPEGDRIEAARLSAGGVAATPLLLGKVGSLLAGKAPEVDSALIAARAAMEAVSPIDDVRGSAEYRRLALGRLVLAHFARIFPALEAGLTEAAASLSGPPETEGAARG